MQPTVLQTIFTTVDGRRIRGTYSVSGALVTVSALGKVASALLGYTRPGSVAMDLLRKIVRETASGRAAV